MATMFQIAVAGAHLSGLALNHQLVELGARLVRSVRTAPVYRELSSHLLSPIVSIDGSM
jgi:allophanate hydrolase